jgi:gluconolactonase
MQRALIAIVALTPVAFIGCSSTSTPAPSEAAKKAETGSIVRLDPGLDAVVPVGATVEKLAGGFKFLEGPLWRPSGNLWFSDLVGNVVHQWAPDGRVTDILNPGGYDKNDAPPGSYIGPNGMVAGPDNTVLLCQHGNRRIVQITSDMKVTTLVDRFEGKRINSPNDLVYAQDGALYFTDPPLGLVKQDEDPGKELKFNAVFRMSKGKLQPIITDLGRPNGIAFSPDYKTLYVSNSEANRKVWMRYDVAADGTVSNGRVFADATSSPDDGLPDGIKVDSAGNVYGAGPGGVWVFSPEGKHLGTIRTPETPSNSAWGDDGKSLYITAVTGLYRIKLAIAGQKPLYN